MPPPGDGSAGCRAAALPAPAVAAAVQRANEVVSGLKELDLVGYLDDNGEANFELIKVLLEKLQGDALPLQL